MYKYIIFDFNGTLLDDVIISLDALNFCYNKYIDKNNKISLKDYLDKFSFPVGKYYESLGFDFNKIKGNDIIIFSTGWENKMGTDEYFDLWPYIDEKLAEKLVELKIKTVGLDTPSVDSLETNNLTHKILFSNNICVIESLVNLEKLKNKSFFFSAAPLKISEGEGSPVRAYAIIDL